MQKDTRRIIARALWVGRPLLLVAVALSLGLGPQRADGAISDRQQLPVEMIRVAPDGWHFVDGRGNRFTPFGCTYADLATWPMEKRDERWDQGKTGPAVIEAFDPVRTDRHFKV